MYTASDKLQSHKHRAYANAVNKVLNSSSIASLIPKTELSLPSSCRLEVIFHLDKAA